MHASVEGIGGGLSCSTHPPEDCPETWMAKRGKRRWAGKKKDMNAFPTKSIAEQWGRLVLLRSGLRPIHRARWRSVATTSFRRCIRCCLLPDASCDAGRLGGDIRGQRISPPIAWLVGTGCRFAGVPTPLRITRVVRGRLAAVPERRHCAIDAVVTDERALSRVLSTLKGSRLSPGGVAPQRSEDVACSGSRTGLFANLWQC